MPGRVRGHEVEVVGPVGSVVDRDPPGAGGVRHRAAHQGLPVIHEDGLTGPGGVRRMGSYGCSRSSRWRASRVRRRGIRRVLLAAVDEHVVVGSRRVGGADRVGAGPMMAAAEHASAPSAASKPPTSWSLACAGAVKVRPITIADRRWDSRYSHRNSWKVRGRHRPWRNKATVWQTTSEAELDVSARSLS